jgi:hypothetical protein
MHKLDNENSKEHWKFVNVNNKTVLDLGCGRWNRVERVEDTWLTTPEYFISKGASKVIGVDIDPSEIDWFSNKITVDNRYEFILYAINSSNDLKLLYEKYRPNCVKFDIETAERTLFDLDIEYIRSVEEYYIETHGADLYNQFIDFLPKQGYNITEQIDLTHTNGYCKVIFATRI